MEGLTTRDTSLHFPSPKWREKILMLHKEVVIAFIRHICKVWFYHYVKHQNDCSWIFWSESRRKALIWTQHWSISPGWENWGCSVWRRLTGHFRAPYSTKRIFKSDGEKPLVRGYNDRIGGMASSWRRVGLDQILGWFFFFFLWECNHWNELSSGFPSLEVFKSRVNGTLRKLVQ